MPRYLALALIIAVSLTAAVATAGNTTYSDAAGDSGTAPDLTNVVVTDTGGFIAFKIDGTLVPSSSVEILIDTDRNQATGDSGAELWLSVFQEGDGKAYWDADRWNGSTWEDPDLAVVSQTFPGREEIGFKAVDAGITGPFDFMVVSVKMAADAVESRDRAPDSIVPWTYELAAQPTKPVTPVLGQPRFTPSRPMAGKPLTVRVPARRSDTNAALAGGTTTCTVRAGARSAKGRGAAATGWATCRLVVPKAMSHTTVRGSIVVTYEGKAATRSFSLRVA
jgi:hypothetical protein